jgi:hypothetical protein
LPSQHDFERQINQVLNELSKIQGIDPSVFNQVKKDVDALQRNISMNAKEFKSTTLDIKDLRKAMMNAASIMDDQAKKFHTNAAQSIKLKTFADKLRMVQDSLTKYAHLNVDALKDNDYALKAQSKAIRLATRQRQRLDTMRQREEERYIKRLKELNSRRDMFRARITGNLGQFSPSEVKQHDRFMIVAENKRRSLNQRRSAGIAANVVDDIPSKVLSKIRVRAMSAHGATDKNLFEQFQDLKRFQTADRVRETKKDLLNVSQARTTNSPLLKIYKAMDAEAKSPKSRLIIVNLFKNAFLRPIKVALKTVGTVFKNLFIGLLNLPFKILGKIGNVFGDTFTRITKGKEAVNAKVENRNLRQQEAAIDKEEAFNDSLGIGVDRLADVLEEYLGLISRSGVQQNSNQYSLNEISKLDKEIKQVRTERNRRNKTQPNVGANTNANPNPNPGMVEVGSTPVAHVSPIPNPKIDGIIEGDVEEMTGMSMQDMSMQDMSVDTQNMTISSPVGQFQIQNATITVAKVEEEAADAESEVEVTPAETSKSKNVMSRTHEIANETASNTNANPNPNPNPGMVEVGSTSVVDHVSPIPNPKTDGIIEGDVEEMTGMSVHDMSVDTQNMTISSPVGQFQIQNATITVAKEATDAELEVEVTPAETSKSKNVMSRTHEIANETAAKFGGSSKDFFSEALKTAHAEKRGETDMPQSQEAEQRAEQEMEVQEQQKLVLEDIRNAVTEEGDQKDEGKSGGIFDAIKGLFKGGLFKNLFNALKGFGPKLISALGLSGGGGLLAAVKGKIGGIFGAIKGLFKGGLFKNLFNALKGFGPKLLSTLGLSSGGLLAAGKGVLGAAARVAPWAAAVYTAAKAFDETHEEFVDQGNAIDNGLERFRLFSQNLVTAIPGLVDSVAAMVGIETNFKGFVDGIFDQLNRFGSFLGNKAYDLLEIAKARLTGGETLKEMMERQGREAEMQRQSKKEVEEYFENARKESAERDAKIDELLAPSPPVEYKPKDTRRNPFDPPSSDDVEVSPATSTSPDMSSLPIRVTSADTGEHRKGSKHGQGMAIDLTPPGYGGMSYAGIPLADENPEAFAAYERTADLLRGMGLKVVDEYSAGGKTSQFGSARHIHAEGSKEQIQDLINRAEIVKPGAVSAAPNLKDMKTREMLASSRAKLNNNMRKAQTEKKEMSVGTPVSINVPAPKVIMDKDLDGSFNGWMAIQQMHA